MKAQMAGCGAIAALVLGCALVSTSAGQTKDEADTATGERLAEFLRDARAVVSNNQPVINSPNHKAITSDWITARVIAVYTKNTGSPPWSGDGLTGRDRRLIDAQIASLREVIDEHQNDINRPGVGFKGFVPALFARLMNERFAEKVGDEARIRVTAPRELVRNRKALPDKWETKVITTVFSGPAREKGTAHIESVEVDGRPAFRMLIPEYYTKSCLVCHGTPKGQIDITGYPKEGGKVGDLGGAISIVLFK
jgi:hypothetical protein